MVTGQDRCTLFEVYPGATESKVSSRLGCTSPVPKVLEGRRSDRNRVKVPFQRPLYECRYCRPVSSSPDPTVSRDLRGISTTHRPSRSVKSLSVDSSVSTLLDWIRRSVVLAPGDVPIPGPRRRCTWWSLT